MQALKERISSDGKILPGSIVKVDSFLNHQMDPVLMKGIGEAFYKAFAQEKITRILTIESSGIAAALMTGLQFGVPVVFAKKHKSANMSADCFVSNVYSYTKKTAYDITVSKEYLAPDDRVLIVDDFLATGNALKGLLDILKQSGATAAGVGIVIEKAFQSGGKEIRDMGLRVVSLARILTISETGIVFADDDGEEKKLFVDQDERGVPVRLSP